MRVSSIDSGVYLSTLEREDAETLQSIGNDPEIAHNSPSIPYPYKLEQAVLLVEVAAQKYISREEFHLGIRLPGNELIGLCALSSIDYANKKAELGYWLARKQWGRGYAKEAIELILGFGYGKLGLNRIYAKVLTTNERSIGLLGSLGFSEEGIHRQEVFRDGAFFDDISYSLLKKEHRERYKIVVEE